MLNAGPESRAFTLPEISQTGAWNLEFYNTDTAPIEVDQVSCILSSQSFACLLYNAEKQNNLLFHKLARARACQPQ
jgi:hypothetical protein